MARECIIPKNMQGMNDWEYGIYNDENMISVVIPDSEFEPAFKGHFFDAINKEFNLLIDVFEEERIPHNQLSEILNYLRSNRKEYDMPYFEKALKYGLQYGSYVDCYF